LVSAVFDSKHDTSRLFYPHHGRPGRFEQRGEVQASRSARATGQESPGWTGTRAAIMWSSTPLASPGDC